MHCPRDIDNIVTLAGEIRNEIGKSVACVEVGRYGRTSSELTTLSLNLMLMVLANMGQKVSGS